MRDVNYHQGIYENWKEYALKHGIEGISKKSSDWVMKFLFDLEEGKNLGRGSRKGPRSHIRLNSYRHKLTQWSKLIEGRGKKSILDADVNTLHEIMTELRKDYAPATLSSFGREFKAFWNWYVRTQRLEGQTIYNIAEDLESAAPKSRFCYITKEQLDEILPYLDYEEQLTTLFLFDSLTRPPKELLNLKVKDIYEKDGEVWVNIGDDIAKNGFGRQFNLLYSGDQIKKHIKENELQEDDFIFMGIKKYKETYIPKLKLAAKKLWGDKISHPKAGKRYSEFEPYDLRHSGAIHLRIIASKNNSISPDAIRQRGGWQGSQMVDYYTAFLGLTGEIKKDALLVEEDKSRLEKEVENLKKRIKQKDEVADKALQEVRSFKEDIDAMKSALKILKSKSKK
jgi:integrase